VRAFDRSHRRGFTLVEMMVAVVIGGICVLMAAEVGQSVIRFNAKAREVDDSLVRVRLITKQIRDDLRMAGYGSTGAIGVDIGNGAWTGLFSNTPEGNFPAIPAVYGFDNPAGPDALQIVVPNPMTVQVTTNEYFLGGAIAGLPTAMNCPNNVAYISDHTAPSGAGRTQLVQMAAGGTSTVDTMRFTVAAGAEIMCARVSTYWVDTTGLTPILRRSDLNPATPGALRPGFPGTFRVPAVAAGTDELAPGIADFQVAYRVTTEAYTLAGVSPLGASFWAFDGLPGDFGPNMGTAGVAKARWFEVRNVRINLLSRSMQKFAASNNLRSVPAAENGIVPPNQRRGGNVQWISTGESLVNLRYFDLGAPTDTPAEPY
jgi:prepilin-type N-terminal cleavage/methylation domain-containing protein